jgi:NADH:ubiquinone oxidoreductase subunit 5 (subunit L)/multisubunit Na+/H+ antiporter MnhA subunit
VGDLLSLGLLVVMSWGSMAVAAFVYVEMWEDKEGVGFLLLLLAFLFFMAFVAAAANLAVFYLGWEGIGLVSLFLINFWAERARGFKASYKVYCINKVGDLLLLLGMCSLLGALGCVDFGALEGSIWLLLSQHSWWLPCRLNDVAAALLVVGGGVKSAQFGFHIWLLEAMEAPLGASALMHSSTLVVAGVYLVLRTGALVESSWGVSAFVGAWGA